LEIRKSGDLKDLRRPTVLRQIREIQSSLNSSRENQTITESLVESSFDVDNEGSSINSEEQRKIDKAKKSQARNSELRQSITMKSDLSNRIMKGMNADPERFLKSFDKKAKAKEKADESDSDKGSIPKLLSPPRKVSFEKCEPTKDPAERKVNQTLIRGMTLSGLKGFA